MAAMEILPVVRDVNSGYKLTAQWNGAPRESVSLPRRNETRVTERRISGSCAHPRATARVAPPSADLGWRSQPDVGMLLACCPAGTRHAAKRLLSKRGR